MRKIFMLTVILMISIVLLTSCSIDFSTSNVQRQLDTIFEQALNAIQDEDIDAFAELFSKQIRETDEFYNNLNNLFQSLALLNITDWSGERSGEDGYRRFGQLIFREVRAIYTIEANEQRYFVLLTLRITDIESPANIGIKRFIVTNEEIWERREHNWDRLQGEGIVIVLD